MKNLFTLDVLSVVVITLISIYAYFKLVAFQYWKKRNVPYFEPTFPYGTIEAPHRRTVNLGDATKKLYDIAKKENGWKFFGTYRFTSPVFTPTDLDLIKNIMTKDFNSFIDRGIYYNEKDDPISAHLFAIGGAKWKNLRSKLTPTFTSGKMRMMFQTLVECSKLLDQTLDKLSSNNSPVDIKNVLGCFATDIIGSCAFGLECNTIEDPDSPFRQYGKRIFDRTPLENLKSIFAMSFQDISRTLRLRLIPKDVSTFFSDVVKKTIAYREKNNVTRNDFLQILINIKNNKDPDAKHHVGDGTTLTIDEMIAQCFVFFLAGFETSSTTMTFVLLELARHPQIQDKVRDEISAVLKKHDGKITYDSVKEMVYLQQVINETLRMYPPVPLITRVCTENYKVPESDVIIEKGVSIIIPVKGIHYDEEYYSDPTEFNPDRFSEEQKQQRHQYAHIPFGEGPRICIGMRFGLMQTKVGLITILKNHRVSLSDKMKLPISLVPKDFVPSVEGGVWLNINKV